MSAPFIDVDRLVGTFDLGSPNMRAQMYVDDVTFARWWFTKHPLLTQQCGRDRGYVRIYEPPKPTSWRGIGDEVPFVRTFNDATLPPDSHVIVKLPGNGVLVVAREALLQVQQVPWAVKHAPHPKDF